ncbi:MAG: lytic transglycosylase domain-containing protein [Pyrinomonadaceae bacterium]
MTQGLMQNPGSPVSSTTKASEINSKSDPRPSPPFVAALWLRRFLPLLLLLLAALSLVGLYFGNRYWIHRFDPIIQRQAAIYRLDPKLVWSVIYQETYFQTAKIGEADEVGLMQITPLVAREWAKETGIGDFEEQIARDHIAVLREPERNVQIGCWYLEKLGERYRDSPAPEARVLAAYNAGASRVSEWDKVPEGAPSLSENEFISRIDIRTTRAYVTEILQRYRSLQSNR